MMPRPRTDRVVLPRAVRRGCITVGALLVLAVATVLATAPASQSASSATVVSVEILSATTIEPTGCTAGVAGRTDFGTLLPATLNVTTDDCAVAFGSSNDTARLRMRQGDASGVAMWMPTRGARNAGFGTAGLSTFELDVEGDVASGAALQSDGKLIVAGTCWGGASGDHCLSRIRTDGTLDPAFGVSGTRRMDMGASNTDQLHDVLVQPDGRIVTAGGCHDGSTIRICVARYLTSGSSDTSFNGSGRHIVALPSAYEAAHEVELMPDGRIVVGGGCGLFNTDFCIARFHANGTLDTTLAGTGRRIYAPGSSFEIINDIAVQPDGRILATGTCDVSSAQNMCVVRFNVDGSVDSSFATAGLLRSTFGYAYADARALALLDDGRFLIGGWCQVVNNEMCVARVNANGTLDTSFGTNGVATPGFGAPFGNREVNDMVLESDGSVLLTGTCATQFCLARLDASGQVDASVGTDGLQRHVVGPIMAQAKAVAGAPDGRAFIVGDCTQSSWENDTCVLAIDNGGVVDDYVTGGGADRDWSSGSTTGMFGACLRAVSGGATADWSISNPCTTVDGPGWNAVSASPTSVARTTAVEPTPVDATAHIRFGLRTRSSQPPGRYIAPIVFEVIAPS